MKLKRLWRLSVLLLLTLSLSSCGWFNHVAEELPYTELGIPSSGVYEKGSRAICAWDLLFFKDKLYVGAGDYDKNAGPIHIFAYDKATLSFTDTGAVPDEEVSKFLLLGGLPVIPGTDPQGDWSHGNYYRLEDGTWKTHSQIPNGIHNFDMVEFDGKLFAGLGVLPGESPIAYSRDGGNTFSPLPLKEDGETIDTSLYETVRVYDFFVCGETLYALFVYGNNTIFFDLFRYEGDHFSHVSEFGSGISLFKISGKLVNGKVNFKNKLFFTTGQLYVTENMEAVTLLQPPHATVVYDLLTDNGRLYTLVAEKTDDGYRVSVSSTKTGGEDDFREEFYFYYSVPPISFEKVGNTFYFGMGSIGDENEKNGMILKVLAK